MGAKFLLLWVPIGGWVVVVVGYVGVVVTVGGVVFG